MRRVLESLCAKANIDYAHFPQVGVPSWLRTNLSTKEAYQELFRHYKEEILPVQQDTVAEIGKLMEESPSALLCFETHHTLVPPRPAFSSGGRRNEAWGSASMKQNPPDPLDLKVFAR